MVQDATDASADRRDRRLALANRIIALNHYRLTECGAIGAQRRVIASMGICYRRFHNRHQNTRLIAPSLVCFDRTAPRLLLLLILLRLLRLLRRLHLLRPAKRGTPLAFSGLPLDRKRLLMSRSRLAHKSE